MCEAVNLITYIFSSTGLTILIVWPQEGGGAWVREKLLRPALPQKLRHVLDCYICLSFWASLVLSPVWAYFVPGFWPWFGCLMTPAIFWLVLQSKPELPDNNSNQQ